MGSAEERNASAAKTRKIAGTAVEVALYTIMVLQMLYVFLGNIPHEILGIAYFVLLAVHIIFKRKWIKAFLRHRAAEPAPGGQRTSDLVESTPGGKVAGKPAARRSAVVKFNGAVIICLMAVSLVMAVSAMGVSRTIFPWFNAVQSPDFHRYLATAMLALAVVHGGMHFYVRSRKRRRVVVIICVITALAVAFGLAGVPYINRHFRSVEIDFDEKVGGERLATDSRPLVVYFTRVGNTDFEADVDAVSGASLLKADGVASGVTEPGGGSQTGQTTQPGGGQADETVEPGGGQAASGATLMGNTELMAYMIRDIIDCDIVPITLKGERYPSSYSETVMVAAAELREDARPAIEAIDTAGYSEIILIYPLWWGTIPMPVATFLENTDLAGKTLYLLATQGSTGFGSSVSDVTSMSNAAAVVEGVSIYCDDIPEARPVLEQWIKSVFD